MATSKAAKESSSNLTTSPGLRRYDELCDLIANVENPTPIVRLGRVVPAPGVFYLKLEWMNPFGSIKDRTAHYLLKGLEERGALDGKEIVEPTSGNTGIALAGIAARMKKKIKVTVPSGVPDEKKLLLRMLGAEVWETPDDLCPIDHPKDGAIALAHSMAESADGRERYVMPNQYANPDNVKAHFETTGPEIWRQTEGKVQRFIAGYGTCGTLTGVARFLKSKNKDIEIVAVEPQKNHRIPGLKNLQEAKTPEILDRSVIDKVIHVEDGPAYAMTKRLYREEGLIIGPSTGAIVHAAVELAADGKLTVGISPDSGFKYTSYFADILGEEGLPTT
ncbi:MAG: cysteine synthase family protein [Deltaproteobacteria bacterium]|nr:cysteine synthase family protein [Deltaproteobacteria bacterium]